MKNLENGSLEFPTVEEFLADLKQEFGNRDNESVKIAELNKVEQGSKIIEMFIQKFKKVARESRFDRRLLIKQFKREMNRIEEG